MSSDFSVTFIFIIYITISKKVFSFSKKVNKIFQISLCHFLNDGAKLQLFS